MNLLLLGHAPEFDKAVVATCLSSPASRIWPAIFIAMLVVAESSVFATHALGNPRTTLACMRERSGAAREHLAGLQRKLAAVEVPASSVSADLKQVAAHLDGLDETLRPYKL